MTQPISSLPQREDDGDGDGDGDANWQADDHSRSASLPYSSSPARQHLAVATESPPRQPRPADIAAALQHLSTVYHYAPPESVLHTLTRTDTVEDIKEEENVLMTSSSTLSSPSGTTTIPADTNSGSFPFGRTGSRDPRPLIRIDDTTTSTSTSTTVDTEEDDDDHVRGSAEAKPRQLAATLEHLSSVYSYAPPSSIVEAWEQNQSHDNKDSNGGRYGYLS